MHIVNLINQSSGSVPADACAQLEQALASYGASYQTSLLLPETMKKQFKAAVSSKPDLVIAWGGDGTIAAALDASGTNGPPVLPLPGGTMNLLHKAVHGKALSWEDCLAICLEKGRQKPIAAGRVGSRKFYVAAMIGSLTRLASSREALRQGKPLTAIDRLRNSQALKLVTALSLTTPDKRKPQKMTALAILPGQKAAQGLEIAAIDPDTQLDLAMTGLSAIAGDWRTAHGVDRQTAQSATVRHMLKRKLPTTLDGELTQIPSGSRFTRINRAATVLAAEAA